jgi:glycosyltransferase involved in cell wall biosynthesis
MEKPLVSIMIPTHNDSNTLARCLQSVLEQDYENMMVVALDNQSSDGSYDILTDFEKRYRDRLYIGRTFSCLSQVALQDRCGDLINPRTMVKQYLPATDVLAPTYVSRCVDLLESNKKMGCVLTHADAIQPNGSIRPVPRHRSSDCVISGESQMEFFMANGLELNLVALYRTEIFALSRQEGFIFNRHSAWLALVMASSISDLGYIHDSLAFRGDPKSALGDQFVPCLEDFFEHYLFLQAFNTIAARLGKDSVCSLLPRALQRLGRECIECSSRFRKAGNEQAARSYLSLALAFAPEIGETHEIRELITAFTDRPQGWP